MVVVAVRPAVGAAVGLDAGAGEVVVMQLGGAVVGVSPLLNSPQHPNTIPSSVGQQFPATRSTSMHPTCAAHYSSPSGGVGAGKMVGGATT